MTRQISFANGKLMKKQGPMHVMNMIDPNLSSSRIPLEEYVYDKGKLNYSQFITTSPKVQAVISIKIKLCEVLYV